MLSTYALHAASNSLTSLGSPSLMSGDVGKTG
eukprot:CAMPEP_0182802152 /NCGR_PEP_ID=MMETSP0006_2-20121128/3332_1 /TAXON_ID=97485 /ORGANISM="Prymnesium parvum, Strain Texoma1" /LENGTH=31 /DNA_ID= /DNA_START= /DNA_END= /DNA_ORIENTATION=